MGKRNNFLSGILFLFLLTQASWVEARLINLSGSLDLSYGETKTEQNSTGGNSVTDETSYFTQRYNLRNFGELFNPRIGTFLLSGTFFSQETSTSNRDDQDFKFYDYSMAVNLLPYISPLNIYYQRVNRTNTFDTKILNSDGVLVTVPKTNRDRLTTIGGSWSLSAPRLPRIALSYSQSELDSPDDANRLPNSSNRFLDLESSGRIGETTLTARYQFNESEVALLSNGTVRPVRGNALNLTTESRLAPALVASTFLRLTTRGANSSGTSTSQQRGLGASLFYTPSTRWDTHARFDYSDTAGNVELKRTNVSWGASYRPTEILDMVVSARYFRNDISNIRTSSPFVDYSLNYRPFFGFSSGFGASYGETQTKGAGANLDTSFQRYRGYMNYTRSVELLRYTSSYSVAYGSSDTAGQGDSTDLTNTIEAKVENTRIRILHAVLSYALTDINRSLGIPAANRLTPVPVNQELDDQRSHRVQLNVDSSYFRGILRVEDSLLLQTSTSWTTIEGFGPANEIFVTDIRGTYYFMQGGVFSGGWTYQNYPSDVFLDSQLFYEEIRYTTFIGATRFNFGTRAVQERTQGLIGLDRDTVEATASMSYKVGKFSLSLDGRWSEDLSKSKASDVSYQSQSLFARMSRAF